MSVSALELAQIKQWVSQDDNNALTQWVVERERQAHQALIERIGALTRGLYDSINTLQVDAGESHNEQTTDRLRFVIERSQESANRVLDAVDQAQPIAHRVLASAQTLAMKWNRLGARELTGAEFRELYSEMKAFLSLTEQECNDLNDSLQSIVLAQDFQDLTGQVLERVIAMLTRVEHSLIALISEETQPSLASHQVQEKSLQTGLGPQSKASSDSVASQADVDDLLSSLGF